MRDYVRARLGLAPGVHAMRQRDQTASLSRGGTTRQTQDVFALDLGCGQGCEGHPNLVAHRRFLLPHPSSASPLAATTPAPALHLTALATPHPTFITHRLNSRVGLVLEIKGSEIVIGGP